MRAREAEEGDRDALGAFECATTFQDWDKEVQVLVRGSLEWRAERDCRRVWLFEEDDGELVAVAAYDWVDPLDVRRGFWFQYMAVSRQARERIFGSSVFEAVFHHLATEYPGPNGSHSSPHDSQPDQRLLVGETA